MNANQKFTGSGVPCAELGFESRQRSGNAANDAGGTVKAHRERSRVEFLSTRGRTARKRGAVGDDLRRFEARHNDVADLRRYFHDRHGGRGQRLCRKQLADGAIVAVVRIVPVMMMRVRTARPHRVDCFVGLRVAVVMVVVVPMMMGVAVRVRLGICLTRRFGAIVRQRVLMVVRADGADGGQQVGHNRDSREWTQKRKPHGATSVQQVASDSPVIMPVAIQRRQTNSRRLRAATAWGESPKRGISRDFERWANTDTSPSPKALAKMRQEIAFRRLPEMLADYSTARTAFDSRRMPSRMSAASSTPKLSRIWCRGRSLSSPP